AIENHFELEGGLLSFRKGDTINVLDCSQVVIFSKSILDFFFQLPKTVVNTSISKYEGGRDMFTGLFRGKLGFFASHCIHFLSAEPIEDSQPIFQQLLEVMEKKK